MPSPTSSRRNLSKVHRERSAEETGLIKRLIWQWALQPEDKRLSQKGLARQLEVTRQYIAKVAKQVVLDAPSDLLERPVSVVDLKGARDRRRFYTPAPCPTFENENEQTGYCEPTVGATTTVPQFSPLPSTQNQPGSPYHSNYSPYTAPRTYREWEQEGMLDGPRRNPRPVRRVLFRVPL